jgi:alkanesulfonate monooxygenase SsuD/methylene tetrahydromethanopterin reductase-like flavin-dependent oxidoreductase (luciferase family)
MAPEFRALGVDRRRRGAITDETLAFLDRCFSSDEVELNGQRFLFRPRPARPPILVGGAPPHALRRVAAFGDGWMPMAREPQGLAPAIEELRRLTESAGRPAPAVAVLTGLPLGDTARAVARAREFEAVGATQLIHGMRYADAAEYRAMAGSLAKVARELRGLVSA